MPAAKRDETPDLGLLPGLRWLRGRLVAQIEADNPDRSQLASLSAQLASVMAQIDVIEKAQQKRGSKVDELANRRKVRRADAKGGSAPAGGRVDGGAGRG